MRTLGWRGRPASGGAAKQFGCPCAGRDCQVRPSEKRSGARRGRVLSLRCPRLLPGPCLPDAVLPRHATLRLCRQTSALAPLRRRTPFAKTGTLVPPRQGWGLRRGPRVAGHSLPQGEWIRSLPTPERRSYPCLDGSYHSYGEKEWPRDDPALDPPTPPPAIRRGKSPTCAEGLCRTSSVGPLARPSPPQPRPEGTRFPVGERGRAREPPVGAEQSRLAQRRSKRDYSPELVTPLDDLHDQEIRAYFAGDLAADDLDVIFMRAEIRTGKHVQVEAEPAEFAEEEEEEVVGDEASRSRRRTRRTLSPMPSPW